MPEDTSVTMKRFEDIVDFKYWANIEEKFDPSSGQSDNK